LARLIAYDFGMIRKLSGAIIRLPLTFKGYWKFGKFVNVYGNFTVLDASRVTVGRNLAINHGVFIQGRSEIVIGNDVVLSARVMIFDGGLDIGLTGTPDNDHVVAPVTIGDRAWIGAGAILLPGITIGSDAVIGAGSVVTRSVPSGQVWAGNPAKRLRDKASNQPVDAVQAEDQPAL
jgi:maltose O-acetyltransferase